MHGKLIRCCSDKEMQAVLQSGFRQSQSSPILEILEHQVHLSRVLTAMAGYEHPGKSRAHAAPFSACDFVNGIKGEGWGDV